MLDFEKKNKQIEMNKERLREEYSRSIEIRAGYGILIILYSIMAAFTLQLIQFAFSGINIGWIYYILLAIYITLLVISLYYAIRFIIPTPTAYLELPEKFYKDSFKQYEKVDSINENDRKYFVRETYLRQLEKTVKNNYEKNNKKNKYHFLALLLVLISILPYLTCVGIKILKAPEIVQKIELVNKELIINNKENNCIKEK